MSKARLFKLKKEQFRNGYKSINLLQQQAIMVTYKSQLKYIIFVRQITREIKTTFKVKVVLSDMLWVH